MPDIDLNFIAKRLDQLGADVANLRDDMTIVTAILSRLEASMTSLVVEFRATHSQMARFNERLRKVENALP